MREGMCDRWCGWFAWSRATPFSSSLECVPRGLSRDVLGSPSVVGVRAGDRCVWNIPAIIFLQEHDCFVAGSAEQFRLDVILSERQLESHGSAESDEFSWNKDRDATSSHFAFGQSLVLIQERAHLLRDG